jgi:hypothetical protein
MKHLLALLFAALLGIAAFSHQNTAILAGKVTDESGEPLIGATVRVLKDTSLVRGTITDVNGDYRLQLEPGTYDVEISYTGYETWRTLGVPVLADKPNTLDISLSGGVVLDEVVVTSYSVPLIEQDKAAGAMTLRSTDDLGKARKLEGRAAGKEKRFAPLGAKSAPITKESGAIKKEEKATEYHLDGVRAAPALETKPASYSAETYEESPAAPEPLRRPGVPSPPKPRAGLLTAGEWNDLHNWNTHWADLLKDGETDAFQKTYQFFPRNRYTVLLQTEEGLPISDAAVQLLNRSGQTIWEARTSNTGSAELWSALFEEKTNAVALTLVAEVDGKRHALGNAKPFSEGLNRHKIKRECRHSKTVDIVWTVDATGSMGDELEYLKTELLDVIGRVQAANPDLAVRMGSVFYRDEGDEYLVKSSALNHDIAKTVDYIRKQSAGGGGDYPEAVHTALEETLRQPWSREAVARICFLVLDASPHQRPEVLESLQKSIREAAKRGIRIVPVSASGIQKDTEFLMKFFGLATNGSYTFLTDHSGIGGKHLEPTTDEYKVELLNDLLVRLITEYTAVPTCEGKSSILFADRQDPQSNTPPLKPVLYYPNPAVSRFNLELPFDAEKVTLYDAEGKAVHTMAQVQAGTHTIAVNTLPPGYYTLRIWKDGQVQSGKVMVVRA